MEDINFGRLDDYGKLLISILSVVYEGDLDSMRKDMRDRLNSPPSNLKLYKRLEEDLIRLDYMESCFL